MLLYIPALLVVLMAIVFLKSFELGPRDELPSALLGEPFPEFSLPSLLTDSQVNRDAVLGATKLVNIWGSWCQACDVEHGLLLDIASSGIAIVGVNYKDEDNAARRWLAARGNPYEINIVDRDGLLAIDLGVTGAPETFVVNADGIIVFKHVGVLRENIWETIKSTYFGES